MARLASECLKNLEVLASFTVIVCTYDCFTSAIAATELNVNRFMEAFFLLGRDKTCPVRIVAIAT